MGLRRSRREISGAAERRHAKRVGLARALMLDPQVVFFDEPTTGLDVQKEQ